jgi:methylisocitrate lyase
VGGNNAGMSTAQPTPPARRLRELLAAGPVMLPGAFNALTARLAERAGFPALYVSGAGLSNGVAGLPDVGLLTLTEMAQFAGYIARAVKVPVLADADTGFGEAFNVERTVREFETAGVAGIHLEDQQMPKRCGHLSGKSLVPAEEMVAKIRAAAAARRDPDFLLVARTDARGVSGFEDAVGRAKLYLAAGADMIFVEALENRGEFAEFARRVQAPLLANMTEFGKSPPLTFAELAEMGYRAVIFPLTAFRVAMKAAEEAYRELLSAGSAAALLPRMQTRQELYDALDYRGYEERDRRFFGGKG